MATYQELKAQAEALLKQAEEVRKIENKEVIAEIRAAIREHGITADQLGFAPAGKGSRTTAPARYRDPMTGKTWAGRGRTPKWMNGGSREAYAL
jgi:DNA-binding protein H-NS